MDGFNACHETDHYTPLAGHDSAIVKMGVVGTADNKFMCKSNSYADRKRLDKKGPRFRGDDIAIGYVSANFEECKVIPAEAGMTRVNNLTSHALILCC